MERRWFAVFFRPDALVTPRVSLRSTTNNDKGNSLFRAEKTLRGNRSGLAQVFMARAEMISFEANIRTIPLAGTFLDFALSRLSFEF